MFAKPRDKPTVAKSKLPIPKKQQSSTAHATISSRKVPDFQKLHQKWESVQQQRKQELKSKLTIPKEFSFCNTFSSRHRLPNDENSNQSSNKPLPTYCKPSTTNDKRSNTTFEKCSSSLNQILSNTKSSNTTTTTTCAQNDPLMRRRSLGPPRRNANEPTLNKAVKRRESIYNRGSATEQHVEPKDTNMSKLERRITSHFQRSSKKCENSIITELDPETPGKISTSYRAGMALLELKKTPGMMQSVGIDDQIDDDKEWVDKLAKDLLKRSCEQVEPEIPIAPFISLDNVPTPPPPITCIRNDKYAFLNDLKECETEDLTFNLKNVSSLIPINPVKIREKSIQQLKRSPAELFKELSGGDCSEALEAGETRAIFSAPEMESDNENFQDDNDTCGVFFNTNKTKHDDGFVDLELGVPCDISNAADDDFDIDEIMKQLADLDHLEKKLLQEIEE